MKFNHFDRTVRILLVFGIVILVNVIISFFKFTFDFSEEKQFTLTTATVRTLEKVPEPILVRILLEGDFPSGFKRLQNSVRDMMLRFKSINPNIDFVFENPNEGSLEDINSRREKLSKDGIVPINLKVKSGTEQTEQLIYPYAILNLGERKIAISLLEQQPELDQEANLNNSISQLEYKCVNAIEKLLRKDKKNILFTNSNGELLPENLRAAELILRPFYNIVHASLDSMYAIKREVDLVIIAKPVKPFSERNKFILDQYLMNGGKMIWFVDALQIGIDSLTYRPEFIPEPLELQISDLFFNYGVRLEPSLVVDLECAKIAQVVGKIGDKPQIELFPWYYFPIPAPYSNHPIVNNIDRMLLDFPARMDTVKTKFPVRKTPLIVSSPYSRYQLSPTKVGFDILRYPPEPSKFDKPHQIMGILLEGEFSSPYEHKLDPSMRQGLEAIHLQYVSKSPETKVIIVADGDFLRNYYDTSTLKFSPMGYSKFEKMTYQGNKSFFLNSVEYLCSGENILEARAKEFRIRLLDAVKIEREKAFWQILNVALPIFLLILFGLVHHYIRKKRFANT